MKILPKSYTMCRGQYLAEIRRPILPPMSSLCAFDNKEIYDLL